MSTYRDELSAALARAEQAEARVRELAGEVEQARKAESDLRSGLSEAPARRGSPILGVVLAMLAAALFLFVSAIASGKRRAAQQEEDARNALLAARAREATLAADAAEERARLVRSASEAEARARAELELAAQGDILVSPQIDRRVLATRIARVRPELATCRLVDGRGVGKVRLVIEPTGRVRRATVLDPVSYGARVAACVERVFEGVRVEAFAGDPVTVVASFSLD